MVALRKPTEQPVRRFPPVRRELYREICQDDEGNRYTVIVWRNPPGTSVFYTLEDGTRVHYEDECVFALPSGRLMIRCEDQVSSPSSASCFGNAAAIRMATR